MIAIHASSLVRLKLCKNCTSYSNSSKECLAFVKYSCVTGEKSYPLAEEMRTSVDYCGVGGKYYDEKEVFCTHKNK